MLNLDKEIARFWDKVDRSGNCWRWTSATDRQGYGEFSTRENVQRRVLKAHRVALAMSGVRVDAGVSVCHTCDNPPCVNPSHLFVATNRENRRDSVVKMRHAYGERSGHAILTDEIVREIRRRYEAGEHNQSAIGRDYGVGQSCIYAIINRITWKHL